MCLDISPIDQKTNKVIYLVNMPVVNLIKASARHQLQLKSMSKQFRFNSKTQSRETHQQHLSI